MGHFARSYDVHGLLLEVQTTAELLTESIDDILGPFAASSACHSQCLLRIGYQSPPSASEDPPGLPRKWSGKLPDGVEAVYYAGGDVERLDLLNLASLEIHLTRRQAMVTVAAGTEAYLSRGCLVPVLCRFLGQAGQHVVHAACIHFDNGNRRKAILLSGTSGTGKTTTSLALARAGMKLMGDDVTFVGRRDKALPDELRVWALLFACKVHHRTRGLLPWLNDFPSRPARSEGEDVIDIRQALGAPESTEAEPAAIFFLQPRNQHDHQVQPMDRIEALSDLTRENVRAGNPALHPQAADAFGMLANLVRCCPTYRLSVGPDLDSLCGRLLPLLGA